MVSHTSGLTRDLEILTLLGGSVAHESGGLGVLDIARALHRDKGQISRVCQTLYDAGILNRERHTRKYTLGHQLYALALRTQESHFALLARPTLLELMAKAEESSHLTVLRGGSIFTVHTELAQHPERDNSLDGVLLPALNTASGRAILSTFSPPELAAWWEEHGVTRPEPDGGGQPNSTQHSPRKTTITTWAQLEKSVQRVRRYGYAISDGELTRNIVDAAAPLFNSSGLAIGAIAVGARRNRIKDGYRALGALVRESADTLSRDLGWQPTPEAQRATIAVRTRG